MTVAICEKIFKQELDDYKRCWETNPTIANKCAAMRLTVNCLGHWESTGYGYDVDHPEVIRLLHEYLYEITSFRTGIEQKPETTLLSKMMSADQLRLFKQNIDNYNKNKNKDEKQTIANAILTQLIDLLVTHCNLSNDKSSFAAICYVIIKNLDLKVERETYKKIVYGCDFSTPFSLTSALISVASAAGLYKTEDRKKMEIAAIDKLYPQHEHEYKVESNDASAVRHRAKINSSSFTV